MLRIFFFSFFWRFWNCLIIRQKNIIIVAKQCHNSFTELLFSKKREREREREREEENKVVHCHDWSCCRLYHGQLGGRIDGLGLDVPTRFYSGDVLNKESDEEYQVAIVTWQPRRIDDLNVAVWATDWTSNQQCLLPNTFTDLMLPQRCLSFFCLFASCMKLVLTSHDHWTYSVFTSWIKIDYSMYLLECFFFIFILFSAKESER